MPLLRRLRWPLLLVPALFALIVFLAVGRGTAWPLHGLAVALAPASFGLLYWGLARSYARWSQPPPASELQAALVQPEQVVFVSRGGYLTPGSATFTREEVKVFAGGRFLLAIPLGKVARVSYAQGRVLRTPYVDLTAADGRRLARIGVESAHRWAEELARLLPA